MLIPEGKILPSRAHEHPLSTGVSAERLLAAGVPAPLPAGSSPPVGSAGERGNAMPSPHSPGRFLRCYRFSDIAACSNQYTQGTTASGIPMHTEGICSSRQFFVLLPRNPRSWTFSPKGQIATINSLPAAVWSLWMWVHTALAGSTSRPHPFYPKYTMAVCNFQMYDILE